MAVKKSQLPNGLTVITDEMDHLESAAISVWVKAGSRNEKQNEHGIAHFLEHMAFKGTKRRSASVIADEIESVGGDLNAATSIETTSYFARVLGDDVELGLDILSDILRNSRFQSAEIEREQNVILQEIGASEDSPEDQVFDKFLKAVFGEQPIGRAILGTPQTVESFGAEDLNRYLSQHYCGPQMVVVGAGSIDHNSFLKAAEEKFGDLPAHVDEPPLTATYQGGEIIEERDIQEAHLLLGFPGIAYQAENFYASQLLAQILGGGMSSRLFQQIRERHGLCYSIYAFHWSFSDTGVFGIHASTGSEDISELCQLIAQELIKVTQEIDQHEIDRARAQVRASLLMSQESPAARAGQLARQQLLFGRIVPNEELLDRLAAITPERLCGLAQEIFSSPEMTLSALGPVKNVPKRAEFIQNLSEIQPLAAE